MPLKLNVGLNRKVGESNYGSRGASVNLEVELDASIVREPAQLREKIDYLFGMAKEAVEYELNCTGHHELNGQGYNRNGYFRQQNGNGTASHSPQPTGNGQRASQKQCEYINQLARQVKGLGVRRLEGLAEKMFGKPVAELTTIDASGLIDVIKEIKEGRISLDDALTGVAA